MNRTLKADISLCFSLIAAIILFLSMPTRSLAQGEGDTAIGAEPVQGAISLSMMPPGDPKLVPPHMRQSSSSINYPDSLLRLRKQGKVELKALVGATGAVTKIEVLSSTGEPFTTLASDGVKGFQFAPATKEGAPVEAWMTIEVGFKVQEKWSTAYHGKEGAKSESDSGSWAYVADVASPKMDNDIFQKNLVYPEEAQKKHIQGTITIKVLVAADGKVLETHLEGEGDPLLAQAAIDAIQKTPFTPGMEEGEAKQMWTMIPVNFGLRPAGEEEELEGADASQEAERAGIIEPKYDQKELEKNLEYFVEIKAEEVIQARVLIDEAGAVKQVLVPEDADLLLSTAAVQAIKRTKFTAGQQNGEAIPVWISIPITFKPQAAKK